jgi:hypothetical protein
VMVLKTTARSLARAIVICAAYVGLEPYLRAWKPDVLIAWNRLIRGQLRDSVVGRSVLVGVLGGVVAQIVGSLGLLFGEPRQIALLADPVLEIGVGPFDLRPLMGPLSALGQIAADLFVSLATFVWIALFFFALRSVLRRNWAAAIAFVFFYAGLPMFASGDLHGGITGAIWWSLLLFLFYRFGIVTTMVCWLTWQLLTWPISLDFGGPGLDIGFLSYLLVGGLALYGFHMCFAVRRAASTPA